MNLAFPNTVTCAATASITTTDPAGVTSTGDLRMIAPTVELAPSFYVDGKLEIINADPSALIPP